MVKRSSQIVLRWQHNVWDCHYHRFTKKKYVPLIKPQIIKKWENHTWTYKLEKRNWRNGRRHLELWCLWAFVSKILSNQATNNCWTLFLNYMNFKFLMCLNQVSVAKTKVESSWLFIWDVRRWLPRGQVEGVRYVPAERGGTRTRCRQGQLFAFLQILLHSQSQGRISLLFVLTCIRLKMVMWIALNQYIVFFKVLFLEFDWFF